jgi:hypothetical protein
MKKFLLLVLFDVLFGIISGCSHRTVDMNSNVTETISAVVPTKKDDSTACAYWKCSHEKKLYMQKYVKQEGGNYRPAGTYKLDQGNGAFPLEDLDKYKSDGEAVNISVGFDPCPYCRNTSLIKCNCGKVYCEKAGATSGTCPWCGNHGPYGHSSWGVGGGG